MPRIHPNQERDMKMRLRCSNPDCCTRTEGETPCFSITVSVGDERELSENLNKIEARHFTCDYCNDVAEDFAA